MDRTDVVVVVTVSDPWEFTDPWGSNVFAARMRTPMDAPGGFAKAIVLDLGVSVRALASEETRYFVVALDADRYARFADGHEVDCSLTGVSADQAAAQTPPDTSHWRGRFPAARAQIKRS